MELFETIDVFEVLKLGSIGLGFLLALLLYKLLRYEQRKIPEPRTKILNSIKVFMSFALFILLIGLISEFSKSDKKLSLKLGSYSLNLDNLNSSNNKTINPELSYIESNIGFAFKKPNSFWSDIRLINGMSEIFRLSGISKVNTIKFKKYYRNDPLGAMFENSSHFYFESKEKNMLYITDSSKTPSIEYLMRSQKKQDSTRLKSLKMDLEYYTNLLSSNDTKEKDSGISENVDEGFAIRVSGGISNETLVELIKKDIAELKTKMKNYSSKQFFIFDSLEAKSVFLLSVLPKKYLHPKFKDLSLASLFTQYANILGLNVDKVIADETKILCGLEITISNTIIENRNSDFTTKKWLCFIQNKDNFFVFELAYPSTSSSTNRYDELQETLNSFVLL